MLLIAAALREEIAPLAGAGWRTLRSVQVGRWPIHRWQTPQGEVAAVATGIGAEGCRDALIQIDSHLDPKAIVCAGFAGATVDHLVSGDIAVAESVVIPGEEDAVPPEWVVDLAREAMGEWRGRPWLFGKGLTSPTVLPNAECKRAAGAEHGVAWVEMESGVAARLAARFAIPWLSVRVVEDALGDDLGESFDSLRGPDGRLGVAAMARLAVNPTRFRRSLALRSQRRAAAQSLAQALALIVPRIVREVEGGR